MSGQSELNACQTSAGNGQDVQPVATFDAHQTGLPASVTGFELAVP